jgi:hypothetical protein
MSGSEVAAGEATPSPTIIISRYASQLKIGEQGTYGIDDIGN